MKPGRLTEIRKRVEAARGSLSTRATLHEIVVAVETLRAHAHVDLPDLLDAYDALREQASLLWDQSHPHAEGCPAKGADWRPCSCARAGLKNPFLAE